MHPDVGHLFITDPSPAFCGIVQRKLADVPVRAGKVDFGVMGAEDIGLLPTGAVSMILLRSVLPHITDVDGFLRDCAGVLPPNGILVCEEPYYEGYMMWVNSLPTRWRIRDMFAPTRSGNALRTS